MPFGEELFAGTGGRPPQQGYGASDGVRQQFTGQQRDNETSLDYFNARYYSSAQGRFNSADSWLPSADPFDPQGWNRYTYTLNNPLRFTDPSGLTPQDPNDPKPNKKNILINPDGTPYQLPSEQVEVSARRKKPTHGGPGRSTAIVDFAGGGGITSGGAAASRVASGGATASTSGTNFLGATFRGVNFGLSAGFVGGQISVKRDKFGNWYLSGGPTLGLSMPVTGSFTATGKTYVNGQEVTLEKDVRDVLAGPSAGITYTGFPIPVGPTITSNTHPAASLWIPGVPALGPPVPALPLSGTVSHQEGLPELTYGPQGTVCIYCPKH